MAKEAIVAADPKKKRLRSQILVIVILAAVYVICHFLTGGRLLSAANLKSLLLQIAYPMMLSTGMVFIFAGGMIDLSIGSQMILAANVGAILVENVILKKLDGPGATALGYVALICGTIVVMVICESLSASCSVFLGIPAWVAGLGCALVFEAAAVLIVGKATSGTAVMYLRHCNFLGTFPWMFILAILVVIVAWFVFNRTTLGFNLRAIGGGGEVAEAMGINRKKTIMGAAVVGAVIIGIAAISQISYQTRYTDSSGMGSLATIFKALGIVLISGSFARIFNDIVGCVVGSFIIGGLFNVLTLFGIPSGTGQDVAQGAIVLLCGILSAIGFKGVQK